MNEKIKKVYPALIIVVIAGIVSSYFHFGLWHKLPWRIIYSDVLPFYYFASAPGFPYLSKVIEYPVLIGLFIQLTGFIGKSMSGYLTVSTIFLTIFALFSTKMLFTMKNFEPEGLLTYWVAAPSMFVFMVYNWDMMTIMCVLISFYFMTRNMDNAAVIFLAIGFSSKFYST